MTKLHPGTRENGCGEMIQHNAIHTMDQQHIPIHTMDRLLNATSHTAIVVSSCPQSSTAPECVVVIFVEVHGSFAAHQHTEPGASALPVVSHALDSPSGDGTQHQLHLIHLLCLAGCSIHRKHTHTQSHNTHNHTITQSNTIKHNQTHNHTHNHMDILMPTATALLDVNSVPIQLAHTTAHVVP